MVSKIDEINTDKAIGIQLYCCLSLLSISLPSSIQ